MILARFVRIQRGKPPDTRHPCGLRRNGGGVEAAASADLGEQDAVCLVRNEKGLAGSFFFWINEQRVHKNGGTLEWACPPDNLEALRRPQCF